jgi:hypothetical protein
MSELHVLLGSFGLIDKIIANIKDEGSNLASLTMALPLAASFFFL